MGADPRDGSEAPKPKIRYPASGPAMRPGSATLAGATSPSRENADAPRRGGRGNDKMALREQCWKWGGREAADREGRTSAPADQRLGKVACIGIESHRQFEEPVRYL